MPIQFICPNGHPLSAPNKQAGKPGRCPKCDVAYVTPPREDEQPDPDAGRAEDGDGTFEFLCPNGHKIKASEEVAGQKAKCPECGERFRVPEHGSDPGDEAPVIDVDADEVVPVPAIAEIPLGDVQVGWSVPDNVLQGEHGMAQVIAWIWDQKEPGVPVEMQLRDGSVMQADCYAPGLSSRNLGVFGVRTESGQIELSAIQWDAVAAARIICNAESVGGFLEE